MTAQETDPHFIIETEFGNIEIKLYDDTPLHKENFIKLVDRDLYNGVIFHRVIKDFMIQGGDLSTRKDSVEDVEMDYTLPAEIVYPEYYHKKGVLAAARTGDNVNPEKRSSSSQFYIVTGSVFTDTELDMMEQRKLDKLKQTVFNELQISHADSIKEFYKNDQKEKLAELRDNLIAETEKSVQNRRGEVSFSDQQRNDYKTIGGSPHLDGEYTIFGEVIDGLEVVDKIQNVETDQRDKPLKNIKMRIIYKDSQ